MIPMNLRRVCMLALVLGLLGSGPGCGDSVTQRLPPVGQRLIVDVAMGDRDNDVVLVWFDVLNRAAGEPADVILDAAGSGIDKGSALDIAAGSLFVANQDGDAVTIYRGFPALTNGQAPDVVLDRSGSGVNRPRDLQVADNDLYVANRDSDDITIYRDVATLASGDAPDAVLDAAGSGIDDPFDLCVDRNTLYVASRGNDSIRIFHRADALASGAAPDVILDFAGSAVKEPKRVTVADNTLFVALKSSRTLLAFRPADGLASGQPPSFVLGGPSLLDEPHTPVIVGGRLWVPSRFAADFGLLGFDDPATLRSGDAADVKLSTPIEQVHDLQAAGGALVGSSNSLSFLFLYLDPARIEDDDPPDLIFLDPRADSPVSLRAVLR